MRSRFSVGAFTTSYYTLCRGYARKTPPPPGRPASVSGRPAAQRARACAHEGTSRAVALVRWLARAQVRSLRSLSSARRHSATETVASCRNARPRRARKLRHLPCWFVRARTRNTGARHASRREGYPNAGRSRPRLATPDRGDRTSRRPADRGGRSRRTPGRSRPALSARARVRTLPTDRSGCGRSDRRTDRSGRSRRTRPNRSRARCRVRKTAATGVRALPFLRHRDSPPRTTITKRNRRAPTFRPKRSERRTGGESRCHRNGFAVAHGHPSLGKCRDLA